MTEWLLDTCVIIDYLRNRPEAVEFIRQASARRVDDFRPVHNLESLADLTTALSRIGPRREKGLTTWQSMARELPSPATLA